MIWRESDYDNFVTDNLLLILINWRINWPDGQIPVGGFSCYYLSADHALATSTCCSRSDRTLFHLSVEVLHLSFVEFKCTLASGKLYLKNILYDFLQEKLNSRHELLMSLYRTCYKYKWWVNIRYTVISVIYN